MLLADTKDELLDKARDYIQDKNLELPLTDTSLVEVADEVVGKMLRRGAYGGFGHEEATDWLVGKMVKLQAMNALVYRGK